MPKDQVPSVPPSSFSGDKGGAGFSQELSGDELLNVLQGLIDGTPDLLAVVDRQYVYRLVNPRFAEWHGTTVARIVGRCAPDVLGERVFEEVVRPHLDRSFSGESVSYAGWFDYPTIGPRYKEVRYFPLRGSEPVEYVAALIRDSTERRQAAEEARRQSAQLGVVVEATQARWRSSTGISALCLSTRPMSSVRDTVGRS